MIRKSFKINHYRNERDLTISGIVNYIPFIILWAVLIVFFDQIESAKGKVLLVSILLMATYFMPYLRFYRNSQLFIESNRILIEIRNKERFYLDFNSIKRVEISKQPFKLDFLSSFYLFNFVTNENQVYPIIFEFSFFYNQRKNVHLLINCLRKRNIIELEKEVEIKIATERLNNLFFKTFPNKLTY